MKTYYIIEKNERLTKIASDNFTGVYKTDNKSINRACFSKTNLVEAKKTAKACGMDVVVYVGNENQNEERVFVS